MNCTEYSIALINLLGGLIRHLASGHCTLSLSLGWIYSVHNMCLRESRTILAVGLELNPPRCLNF